MSLVHASAHPGLSAAEVRVLALVASGRTYRQIATEMSTSVDAVKAHALRIRRRLTARNNSHAVAIAFVRGILKRHTEGAPA